MPKEKRKPALKGTKVQLRLRPAEKAVIARAAQLRDTSLSKFMLEHAYQAAQQVLADQVHFILPLEIGRVDPCPIRRRRRHTPLYSLR